MLVTNMHTSVDMYTIWLVLFLGASVIIDNNKNKDLGI